MTISIDVSVISLQMTFIHQKLTGTEYTIVSDKFPKIVFMPLGQLDTPPWPSWAYYCPFTQLKIS